MSFCNGEGSSPIQGAAPPESQDGGTEGGQPEAISQPVDPSGVGGFEHRLFDEYFTTICLLFTMGSHQQTFQKTYVVELFLFP